MVEKKDFTKYSKYNYRVVRKTPVVGKLDSHKSTTSYYGESFQNNADVT